MEEFDELPFGDEFDELDDFNDLDESDDIEFDADEILPFN